MNLSKWMSRRRRSFFRGSRRAASADLGKRAIKSVFSRWGCSEASATETYLPHLQVSPFSFCSIQFRDRGRSLKWNARVWAVKALPHIFYSTSQFDWTQIHPNSHFFKYEAIVGWLGCPSLPRTPLLLPKVKNTNSYNTLVWRVGLQCYFFPPSLPLCSGLKPCLFSLKKKKKYPPILFLLEGADSAIKVNIYNRDWTFLLPECSCIQAARCSLLFMKQLPHVSVSLWFGMKIKLLHTYLLD